MSPSLLSHDTILPSVMVLLSAGMKISRIAARGATAQRLACTARPRELRSWALGAHRLVRMLNALLAIGVAMATETGLTTGAGLTRAAHNFCVGMRT